jgi:hypothetical protein
LSTKHASAAQLAITITPPCDARPIREEETATLPRKRPFFSFSLFACGHRPAPVAAEGCRQFSVTPPPPPPLYSPNFQTNPLSFPLPPPYQHFPLQIKSNLRPGEFVEYYHATNETNGTSPSSHGKEGSVAAGAAGDAFVGGDALTTDEGILIQNTDKQRRLHVGGGGVGVVKKSGDCRDNWWPAEHSQLEGARACGVGVGVGNGGGSGGGVTRIGSGGTEGQSRPVARTWPRANVAANDSASSESAAAVDESDSISGDARRRATSTKTRVVRRASAGRPVRLRPRKLSLSWDDIGLDQHLQNLPAAGT